MHVIVHACSVGIDELRLMPAGRDMSGYDRRQDPLEVGAMHWELWPSRPELGYDDLTGALMAVQACF